MSQKWATPTGYMDNTSTVVEPQACRKMSNGLWFNGSRYFETEDQCNGKTKCTTTYDSQGVFQRLWWNRETEQFYHSPAECEAKGYADIPHFDCPYCGQKFATQALLNQHIASKHSTQPTATPQPIPTPLEALKIVVGNVKKGLDKPLW